MGHTKDSIHINAPADKVFEFLDDPHNWPTFMVGLSGPDKVTGENGVGQQVEWTFLMAGVHMHMDTRVTELRRDPDGGAHVRGEFLGSSPGWQTWDLKPENGGTLVAMEEEYTVPGSVLGKVADRLIIERMNARDVHHSLENLKLLLEGTST
jgi:coenzyme Q-binding protein COQ10